MNRTELAKAAEISRQALNKWEREGAPVAKLLELPTGDAVKLLKRWQRNNKRPRADGDNSLQSQLLLAQIDKTREEALAKQLKNKKTAGELYDVAEVEADVAELTGMIRARLESIPDELTTEWPADVRQQVTQRMKDKIHLILTAMANWRLSSWDAPAEAESQSEEVVNANE